MSDKHGKLWKYTNRSTGDEVEGPLKAHWEVELDPMSGDYTPEEIDATDLLRKWAKRVQKSHINGLIPIHWYVRAEGKHETMPFQFPHNPEDDPELERDFLTDFTWPVDVSTGKRLNWLLLPVVDKSWNQKREDMGGFIQEATGWKPSILQPFVYLPSIMSIFE